MAGNTGDRASPVDLGALRERVTGTERAYASLAEQVTTLQRDTATQINNLQSSLSGQIRDMGASFAAARTTNWGTILTAAGVVIGLGFSVLNPITGNLQKAAEQIERLTDRSVTKDDFHISQDQQQRRNLAMDAAIAKIQDEVIDTRVTLARTEGAEAERHEEYLREHGALQARVEGIDGSLIKRPEIQSIVNGLTSASVASAASANDRINSVIQSLNELRHDVGANYTQGDALKSAFDRLDKMQTQLNTVAQMLGREAQPPAAAQH